MSVFVYHRISRDKLVTLTKALQEGAWGDVIVTPHQEAKEHLSIPILPLLKLRLSQRSVALASVVSGGSDVLQTHDSRWDAAQRRYVLKIDTAAAEESPELQAAAIRVRKATTLGDGLAQTKLGYDEEIAFGEKQVILASTTKRPDEKTPSLSEDIDAINARLNIKEIEERTAEFKKAHSQITAASEPTGRHARMKLSVAECIAELNDAHRELEKQFNAAQSAETRASLKKLQDELPAAVPQEETPSKPTPPTSTEAKP